MDHRDEFFLNASFTIFSGSNIANHNPLFLNLVKRLQHYLNVVFESASKASSSNYLPIQVKLKSWDYTFSERQYAIKMIYIRYMDTLHRFCFITRRGRRPSLGGTIFANASAEVLDVFRFSIFKSLGCTIAPITISKERILDIYDTYTKLTSEHQDSEILFDTDMLTNGKLKFLKFGVTSFDVSNFSKIAEETNSSPSKVVMAHIKEHTGFNVDEISVYRINCGGIILIKRGKIKIFNEPVWTDLDGVNLWTMILSIAEDVTNFK